MKLYNKVISTFLLSWSLNAPVYSWKTHHRLGDNAYC